MRATIITYVIRTLASIRSAGTVLAAGFGENDRSAILAAAKKLARGETTPDPEVGSDGPESSETACTCPQSLRERGEHSVACPIARPNRFNLHRAARRLREVSPGGAYNDVAEWLDQL